MAWYQKKPKKTDDFDEKSLTYDEKYGQYDYSLDSRLLDDTFEKILLESVGDISGLRVLVCASNSGYEIAILSRMFPTARFVATDISTVALKKLSQDFPSVECVHADMEHLPFEDNEFDIYLNCRAIHSSDTNMYTAIIESIRVTRGKIVISISNGYLVNGKIINGMYDYANESINPEKPKDIADRVGDIYKESGYSILEIASRAEVFIIAQPESNKPL